MYLQLSSGLANGHLRRRKYEHMNSPNTSSSATMTPERACRRSSTPPSHTLPKSRAQYGDRFLLSPPRSPIPVMGSTVPTTSLLSGKTSCGVFLPNCKVSADFLQLRTDSRVSPVPVRLYLTASELVKKSAAHTTRNGCTLASYADNTGANSGSGRDLTISRYPLQYIDVSKSQVSSGTMMVTLTGPSRRDGEAGDAGVLTVMTTCVRHSGDGHEPALSHTSTTRCCSSASNATDGSSNEYHKGGSNGVILVEAYQLLPGQGNIQDWISTVEKNKQKLALLGKPRRSSIITSVEHPQISSVPSPMRPTSIALSHTDKSSVGGQKSSKAFYRRSQSEYDFPSVINGSPTRNKLPTTNGRYTSLHHHYSPHPLFSNSSLPQPRSSTHNGIHLRHVQKDSFKLFRRLSLGGTYRFPSSSSRKSATTQGGESTQGDKTKDSEAGGTYMYGHDLCPTESLSQPVPSGNTPSHSPTGSPSLSRRYDTHSKSVHRDILRRKRRPTVSRSVSEYYNNEDFTEARVPPISMHQISEPIPDTSNHVGNVTNDDGTVPPELKELQVFLTSLPVSHSPSSSPTPSSTLPTPSPLSDDDDNANTGFQSFLRHKQIRGCKIYMSPRAHSASVSSDHLPAWMDKCSPSSFLSPGISATVPRSHKLKTGAAKTIDREGHSGSSSPVPKTSKTPKIFKKFHRRWQSSSGVKLELDMMGSSDMKPTDKLYLLPPKEVAEGLTGMDSELLEHISPDELCDGAWMKRGEKETLAPNVLAMVQAFNQLALLVPTEILSEQTHQQRAKVISAYIQIASKCYYLKNYNSLKAILAGLQSTPVYRLRKTWKDVPSKRRKRFNMLCKLMSEENNWQMYRDELDGCLTSSVPCIPYLGQFLTQVCHQLSYNKMKVEKEEVKIRRRSCSFVSMDDHEKQAIKLQRRSKSFHKSNLDMTSDKRSSAASLSTPVSPVVSDDENELQGGRYRVEQTNVGGGEDSQSLELSFSLDDRVLDLPMSQPEATALDSSVSPSDSSSTWRRSSQQSVVKFHSTPVKDANGYIRPLCVPFPRELNCDECSMSQGYDEPDFGKSVVSDNRKDCVASMDNEQAKSSDEEDSSFRIKIPSISLQRNSSHSSLEDWEAPTIQGRKIHKSRSLESSLGVIKRTETEGAHDMNDVIIAPLSKLTLSHSIPSLDSDSVFSIDDEERGGEGERKEEAGGEGEAEEEWEGGEGLEKREREQWQQPGVLEHSVDSEFNMEGNGDVEGRLTLSLPATTITATSRQSTDVHGERELLFSPVSASPEHSHYCKHDREQSLSTVNSSLGLSHDNRDNSFSPVSMPAEGDHNGQCNGQNSPSPFDTSLTKTIQRSKSVNTTPYRHKWRWKKAVALSSNGDKLASTLTNADPFCLLQVYQMRSRDCYPTNSTCKIDFKTFLSKFSSNSETENYELSFEREP